ncbi:uncharacterized protein LOC126932413 [Macaca thibetana thibetana]|uniref:uncharacterized protein LOC126932413 n=1 Tax=Macaca thibetana thibetana TaxID=257877 RepID=UPI0021BC5372|nr:uncharacterized protein LOC126932413 [Macaca thibetana thibetana]
MVAAGVHPGARAGTLRPSKPGHSRRVRVSERVQAPAPPAPGLWSPAGLGTHRHTASWPQTRPTGPRDRPAQRSSWAAWEPRSVFSERKQQAACICTSPVWRGFPRPALRTGHSGASALLGAGAASLLSCDCQARRTFRAQSAQRSCLSIVETETQRGSAARRHSHACWGQVWTRIPGTEVLASSSLLSPTYLSRKRPTKVKTPGPMCTVLQPCSVHHFWDRRPTEEEHLPRLALCTPAQALHPRPSPSPTERYAWSAVRVQGCW